MHHLIRSSSIVAAAALLLGTASSLWAAPFDFDPGDTILRPDTPSPFVTGTFVDSRSDTFTSGAVFGQLDTWVYSGVADNTLGGYTFVYQLTNLSTPIEEFQGISLFDIGGWSGLTLTADMGALADSSETGVLPKYFIRSGGSGANVSVTFPPDDGGPDPGPPIFNRETSWQLIIHTAVSTAIGTGATITTEDFGDGGTYTAAGVDSLSPGSVGVPDTSSTLLLVVLGSFALTFLAPRMSRVRVTGR